MSHYRYLFSRAGAASIGKLATHASSSSSVGSLLANGKI